MIAHHPQPARPGLDRALARTILLTFLLTFILARVTVLAIMLRWIPTLYPHVSGTQVHPLNYGIFLLSIVGGYVLLAHPAGHALHFAAVLYAIGLALTFDEFGMWLHLGGPFRARRLRSVAAHVPPAPLGRNRRSPAGRRVVQPVAAALAGARGRTHFPDPAAHRGPRARGVGTPF